MSSTSPAPATTPVVNPWIVAIAVMCGTFMEVLDTTVVNVSLPHVAGTLSVTANEATWALTSYLVANAIILPMAGWLAQRFGRKRLLTLSITGFTVTSLLCGLAPSLPMLVFFRVLQGMTGGALQPLSQAVLLEAFPPRDRGKAMGFWGLGIVMAPIIGPVLGGWLTDTMSWRWVFYINVPVGIVSVLMTRAFVHDPPYLVRRRGGIDAWGIGMLAVGMGALQVVLDKGEQDDWFSSRFITALAAVTVLALIALVIRELTVDDPVVDLRVFRDRTYASGVLLMSTVGFVLYGSLVLLPLFLQTLLGYPALQAGIALAPRGVGSFVSMPIVGILTSRTDPRRLLASGLILGAGTLFWLSRINLEAGYWDIFWPQLIQGMALGLLFVPLTTITMDRIAPQHMGNATSLFNVTRNTGGSIGIAVAATLLSRRQQVHQALLGARVVPGAPLTEGTLRALAGAFRAAGADAASAAMQARVALAGFIARQASMVAFVEVFELMTVLFLVTLPLVLIMRRPAHHDGPAAVH